MNVCKKKNPLITCQMADDDFYSTEILEKINSKSKKN